MEENQAQDNADLEIEKAARAQVAESIGGELPPDEESTAEESEASKEAVEESKDEESANELDEDEPIEEDAPKDESVDEGESDKDVPRFAGYTEDQIRAAFSSIDQLRRSLDTTNGRYGNELQQLREKVKTLESLRSNAFDGLAPEKLKRLHADYPELAQLFAADLSDLHSVGETEKPQSTEPQAPVQPEDALTQDRIKRLENEQFNRSLQDLTTAHPDWKQIASYDEEVVSGRTLIKWTDPQFGVWAQQQSLEVQDVIFNSSDPTHLSAVISAYKQQAGTQEETQSKVNTDKPVPRSKPNLEKAILPKGTKVSHSAVTDEEIINKAAQDEIKRNMVGA